MAVSNNYEIKNYTLDGIATQFAIPFDVNVDDYGNAINIVVYLGLTELTKDVDYTISVKTINYPDAVSHTGEKLTVFRRTPIEQPVDFVDNGNFTLEDIETGLDRSIMIEQETSANLDNTVRAQESAELAEQYKDIAIEKASDAEDWAVGTRSDGETPSHSLESSKHWAESADTSASMATSMRNQAAASALVSEGWAKGTQSGTPVDNTSPYYQDNSKYYKEQAALSAGAASGSATSAYNSELAAAASEDMAEKWAENPIDTEVETGRYSAKHWAAKSSVSAGAASVSAYNAGLSETAADTSAKDSEAWAVGQRGGSDVDPSDPTYHNNAKYYADQIGAQTVTPDNTVTLINKTIAYDDNTLTGVVGESATQTLTNKTIAYADNTLTGVQPTITGGASTITSTDLTASKVLVSDADGKVSASSVPANLIVNGAVHSLAIKSGFTNTSFCSYMVVNGVCQVVGRIGYSGTLSSATFVSGLPTPKLAHYGYLPSETTSRNSVFYSLDGSGNLILSANNTGGGAPYFSFTYIVADSWVES